MTVPGAWRLAVTGCLALALVWLPACSTATRRRLTEALFDDPPSRREEVLPASQPLVAPPAAPPPAARRVRWPGSTHGPYAAQLCQACHVVIEGGRSALASGTLLRHSRTTLCRQCHGGHLLREPARTAGAALHGPAAAGLCLACHHPHRSREPSLLRSPKAEVCGGCHLPSSLLPDHPGEGRPCLECHDPHAPGWEPAP